jgi:hypothetical protein
MATAPSGPNCWLQNIPIQQKVNLHTNLHNQPSMLFLPNPNISSFCAAYYQVHSTVNPSSREMSKSTAWPLDVCIIFSKLGLEDFSKKKGEKVPAC